MKFNKIIWISVLLSGLLFSCVSRQKAVPVANVNVQINIDYSQLEYVGEVTGESSQSYLFGVIPVGGRRLHAGVLVPQFGGIALPNNRGVSNALYDALQQKPDADFIMPTSFETERHVMFLGNKTKYTVKAKVFKLKNK